ASSQSIWRGAVAQLESGIRDQATHRESLGVHGPRGHLHARLHVLERARPVVVLRRLRGGRVYLRADGGESQRAAVDDERPAAHARVRGHADLSVLAARRAHIDRAAVLGGAVHADRQRRRQWRWLGAERPGVRLRPDESRYGLEGRRGHADVVVDWVIIRPRLSQEPDRDDRRAQHLRRALVYVAQLAVEYSAELGRPRSPTHAFADGVEFVDRYRPAVAR